MNKKAIVIGAGYGGMALANLLAKAGYDVTIYEKNSTSGGRIAVVEKNGYTFDIGPSWYLMPEVFEQYYQLFGQSAEKRLDLIRFQPGYNVYFENTKELTIQGDVSSDKNLFESIESGAGQKLEKYVKRSSLAYKIATRYFLYNNFQRPGDLIKWPIIKNSLNMLGLTTKTLDAYVSKTFHDQRLKQLLEYHMVFLGSSPFQAPAIYTLMSHLDFISGVYYPRKGMLFLAEDLQVLGSNLGVKYKFNADVQEIIVENGQAKGIKLVDGSKAMADVVISNADLHHTETRLLSPQHQSFPQKYWDKRQPGPGALMVSIGVKGELPTLKHHNLFFVDDWRGNFKAIYEDMEIPKNASIYVCNPTKTDISLAPSGHENLFFLIPIPAGVNLTEKQQESLASKSISEFSKVTKIPDLAERIVESHIFGPQNFKDRYNAWEYNAFGGESHLLRQSVIFRTPNKSRKVKNLFYVGAGSLPGIGLPMCLIGAQLTYKKIIGDRAAGPLKPEDL